MYIYCTNRTDVVALREKQLTAAGEEMLQLSLVRSS
jgi:hypothetical protein